MTDVCLSKAQVTAFRAQQMTSEDEAQARIHLISCSKCRTKCQKDPHDARIRQAFRLLVASEKSPVASDAFEGLRRRLNNNAFLADSLDSSAETPQRLTPMQPGSNLAHFEIQKLLGVGGSANVYLARDLNVSRLVALKVFHGAFGTDPQLRRQQHDEASAAGSLSHSGIIRLIEIGQSEDNQLYIASEYCKGPTLSTWMKQDPDSANNRTAAHIIRRLSDAVAHAHRNGIVHRDLKPSNVILDIEQPQDNLPFTPRLTDFGLARNFQADDTCSMLGVLKGTPRYMAPEQVREEGARPNPASDIYALGVILYELLTKRAPIEGATYLDTLQKLTHEHPPRPRSLVPAIPADLEAICLKCLERQPQNRYSSVEILAEDLQRFLDGRPTLVRPLSMRQHIVRWGQQHPEAGAALVFAACSAMIAITMVALSYLKLEQSNRDLQKLTHQQAELLYASDIQLAAHALRDSDPIQSRILLDRHIPSGTTPDLRGPEWALLNQACLRTGITIADHEGDVYVVRHSRDGRMLGTGGKDGRVHIYETRSFSRLFSFSEIHSQINGLAFSPDSQQLAVASDDGRIRTFDLRRRRQLLNFQAHPELAYQVTYSPEGKWLLSCGNDVQLNVWDAVSGGLQRTLGQHDSPLEALSLSADGRFVAVANRSGGGIWDFHSGRRIHELPSSIHPVSVSFSENGRLVWGTKDRLCLLESVDDQGRVTRIETLNERNDPLQSVAITSSGDWIAEGDRAGTVRLWKHLYEPLEQPSTSQVSGTVLPDATEQDNPPWPAHQGRVWATEFAPSGRYLATAGSEGYVRIWAVDNQDSPFRERRLSHLPAVSDFTVVSANEILVTTTELIGTVNVSLDRPPATLLRNSTKDGWNYSAIAAPTADNNRRMVLATAQGRVRVCEEKTGSVISSWSDPDERNCPWMSVSSSGSSLDLLLDGEFHEFKLPSLQRVRHLPWPRSNAAMFSASREWLALGVWGTDNVEVWNARTHKRRHEFPGHTAPVAALAFSNDEKLLVSAGNDRCIRCWNLQTGQPLCELRGHLRPVGHLSLCCRDQRLLSTSADGVTIIWSVPAGRPLLTIDAPTPELDTTSKAVLTADQMFLVKKHANSVYIYDLRDTAAAGG